MIQPGNKVELAVGVRQKLKMFWRLEETSAPYNPHSPNRSDATHF
jgi:hypothetical protein